MKVWRCYNFISFKLFYLVLKLNTLYYCGTYLQDTQKLMLLTRWDLKDYFIFAATMCAKKGGFNRKNILFLY